MVLVQGENLSRVLGCGNELLGSAGPFEFGAEKLHRYNPTSPIGETIRIEGVTKGLSSYVTIILPGLPSDV